MIEGVIAGIINAIKTEFGAEYKVYDELPEQGLKEPCFYVKFVTPTTVHAVGNRFRKAYVFNITYFPKDTINPNTECRKAEERLAVALQDIVVDKVVVHADAEITGQFIDGNLQLQAGYTIPAILEKEPAENMEALVQTVTAE